MASRANAFALLEAENDEPEIVAPPAAAAKEAPKPKEAAKSAAPAAKPAPAGGRGGAAPRSLAPREFEGEVIGTEGGRGEAREGRGEGRGGRGGRGPRAEGEHGGDGEAPKPRRGAFDRHAQNGHGRGCVCSA
jgi:hypothetical protein